MAKPIHTTVRSSNIIPRSRRFPITPLATATADGGMNTTKNPTILAQNEFTLLQNAGVVYNDIIRRYPLTLFSPAKPDSNPVLAFVSWAKNDGSVKLLRFTADGIQLGTSTWNNLAGTLNGTNSDRFNTAVVNDRFFFANNGADYIQEINSAATSFARLGNAPKYRYITGFANRVVGANDAEGSPTEVGWSGNLNLAVWDSITDQSAGKSDIIESTSDLSDPISGLFGGDNTLIIVRQRSIWTATKTGIASNPFNFVTAVPGIGSDAPDSITRIPGGICFLDSRTKQVYAYVQEQLIPIGDSILESLFSSITDSTSVFASYNTHLQQYSVCIPNSNTVSVRQWTYSFKTKTWWYEDYINITMLTDLDYSGSTTTINDLTGTIDQLIGTINQLGSSTNKVTRFYGTSDGELEQFTENLSDPNIINSNFLTDIRSRIFEIPTFDIYVSEIRIGYRPLSSSGGFSLYYSIDGGRTFKLARTITFSSPSDIGAREILVFKKMIKARQIMFQIKSTSGIFAISNYELWVSQAGDSKN